MGSAAAAYFSFIHLDGLLSMVAAENSYTSSRLARVERLVDLSDLPPLNSKTNDLYSTLKQFIQVNSFPMSTNGVYRLYMHSDVSNGIRGGKIEMN